MPTLSVPGASLFYSIAGSGPLLLLIVGGSGSGQAYARVVQPLSAHYTVVTYDRRGFSQSMLHGTQDYSQRLERDADDAAALIQHLQGGNGEPVCAFGSSSGAIIAQTLLTRHHSTLKIRKLISHEPPLLSILPDAEHCIAETRGFYDIYRAQGPEPAMEKFMQSYLGQEEAQILKNLRGGLSAAPQDPYAVGNQMYWFERELTSYPFVGPNWEGLQEVKEKLVMATSVMACETPEGRAAKVIAEKLGGQAVTLPGGHLGYLTHAEEWAAALVDVLKGTGG